jgi:hypothetical protein
MTDRNSLKLRHGIKAALPDEVRLDLAIDALRSLLCGNVPLFEVFHYFAIGGLGSLLYRNVLRLSSLARNRPMDRSKLTIAMATAQEARMEIERSLVKCILD